MKRAYIIGHPLGHSLSPLMHNAAFKHLGIEAEYLKRDVDLDGLEQTLTMLRSKDVFGANVTVPYKLEVMKYLDEISAEALAIGAVNTIVNKKGKLHGYNTDADGYIRALKEEAGFNPKAKVAVLLGAGGAARAVAYALLMNRVKKLYIYNRTEEKAVRIAKDFADLGDIRAINQARFIKEIVGCDIFVNATTVGMEKDGKDSKQSPIEKMPRKSFVSDLIYKPAETKLLADARKKGLKVQNGLPMLVYQGALAFEMWTGKTAPVEIMFRALNSKAN